MSDATVATAIAQPFLAAVTETFEGLLGIEAIGTPVEGGAEDDAAARAGMSALIEFGGPRYGVALVTFPLDVARATVERLLRDAGGVEEGDVTDGVGELANIIAGRAKAVLSALGFGKLEMSVPTVVTGFSLADLGLEDADWSRIDFATEVGTFTLRVAFARPSQERPTRVLLADDSRVMRKIERAALNGLGPEVVFLEVSNGREVLDVWRREKGGIDLVVLDVKMPELDGYQTIAELRKDERGRGVPVLVVSSLARTESEPRVREVQGEGGGPVAFMGKPFDNQALLACAGELLGRKAGDARPGGGGGS